MTELFAQVVTASGYGSVIILAVCLLRLVLKRAPKNTVCLLWLLVGLRLLLPFEVESQFSLQPKVEPVVLEQPLSITVQEDVPPSEADVALPGYTMPQTTVVHQEEEGKSRNLQAGDILTWVWLAGMTVLAVAGIFSYWKLKYRIREAWRTGDGCWECTRLDTAFVMGILRPRVYLPTGLGAEERAIIVSHERAHIRRLDHFWKLAGYMALTVHWFNPLVWLAYICLCKDMELACDESVIRDMSIHERKAYSKVLVSCAAHHRFIAACPVAFGEVSVRERVKSVMNYKKPKFWIILIAVVALVVTAVCFLTTPNATDAETAARLGGNVFTWEKKYADAFSFEIELDEDGTFCFVDGVDPYFVALGEWSVKEDVLWLRDDMGYRNYYFKVDGNDLIFLEEKSAAFSYTEVADGDRFYMVEDIGPAEEKLAQCRELFETWSSYENYHVRQLNSYAGNILDETSEVDYWKSGDDWLYTMLLPETDNGRMFCRLKKGGVEYQQELYETLTNNPEGWPWFVAEDTSDCMEGNWFKAFDWENANVQYVRTDIINRNKERLTLRVVEDPSAFGKYCPYTVHFLFAYDGAPVYVYMTLDENKGEHDWRRADSAYIMCFCEETTTRIEEAYAECLEVLGKETGTVYCLDKDCTDSSHDHSDIHCVDRTCTNTAHDHYGIACTVEHCDNPAHGHYNHDHH